MTPITVAQRVLSRFDFPEDAELDLFAQRGNINLDAFLVSSGPRRALLQRISTEVFSEPDRVVRNMEASLQAQRGAAPAGWVVPELLATHDGERSVQALGTWRMMGYIEGTVTVKSLAPLARVDQLLYAREAGRGLATYLDATAALDASALQPSLPGYRDAGIYLAQWDCALAGLREVEALLPTDPELHLSCGGHYAVTIGDDEWRRRRDAVDDAADIVAEHRDVLLRLQDLRERGEIADRAIHGDTKLENFLFDAETGRAVALVDLDTVMRHTWLVDWGDMVRSLVNVAGEAERDLDAIRVDSEIYAAVAEGFLGALSTARPREIALMPHAAASIALELGIRFLADYLRGDTYFRLRDDDPDDLNLVKGLGQIRLFERLTAHLSEAERLVSGYAPSAT